MDSCCDKRDRVRHQSRPWHRRQASHRLGVLLGLFALLVMLASHVVHTVDITSDMGRPPATSGATLHPASAELPSALSTATAPPYKQVHDLFLCPVCQLLSQTRHSLASTSASIAPPHRSITAVPGSTLRRAGPDLAASAPRAPPSLT